MNELQRADFEDCFDDQPGPADPTLDLIRASRARRARTHRRVAGVVVTLAVAAVVLFAMPRWDGGPQLAVPAGAPDLVQPKWPGCAAAGAFTESIVAGPPPHTGTVPADFTAVQVRRCTYDHRQAANGDQVLMHVEQEAPVTPELLAYLAQPSVTPGKHVSCELSGVILPWLVLVDREGRYMAPVFPTDECAKPLQFNVAGGPPYNTLDYRDVSADQFRVVESAAAQQAGCSMKHKNMLFESSVRPSKTIDPDLFGGAPVRRCDYVADPDGSEGGTFVSGGPLTAPELATLLEEAVAAAPTGSKADCTTRATRFTVVSTDTDRPTLYVETDGCRRILED